MKDFSELKAMSSDELQNELLILKKEQYNLRFQQASGQLEKTDKVKKIRRAIAKINMLLDEHKKNS